MPEELSLRGICTQEMLHVICATLSYMDPRMVSHGERVAYTAHALWQADGAPAHIDPDLLFIASLLHDIGAYKMDEIDSLLAFDSGDARDHCAYGYSFLKYFSPLADAAEIILYHHLPYSCYVRAPQQYLSYCAYISFADRIDIGVYVHKKSLQEFLQQIDRTCFAPEMPRLFCEADRRFGVIAALHNGSYQQTTEQLFKNIQLTPLYALQFLQQMVYSIDFRSVYTTTHTLNTSVIAAMLGELTHHDRETCTKLYVAGLLHDIGKIAVPLDILESPGKLSHQKMDLMRKHVVYTEKIIRGLVNDELCRMAVRHHEKLDGSGYPRGLHANDLTIPERILAIADIFSALTDRRSYKEAFSGEKTQGILTQMAAEGKLDAQICDLAIKHFDQIMREVERRRAPVLEKYERIQREYRQKSAELSAFTRDLREKEE